MNRVLVVARALLALSGLAAVWAASGWFADEIAAADAAGHVGWLLSGSVATVVGGAVALLAGLVLLAITGRRRLSARAR